eukprot:CAMPEP_0182852442 /NCGR_PEP_ID=MMETSP0034_2-20130328/167_1 /TAXON_ID=156128 /ORGANISM="Nephroselmis pyriformis, Strain CCMP717" /LENGTH=65 /DNA_ID=CAMNT_0024983151 /DNA_START=83 /DNA_END=280 /DNA_ORIENTATION=-
MSVCILAAMVDCAAAELPMAERSAEAALASSAVAATAETSKSQSAAARSPRLRPLVPVDCIMLST